MLSALIFEEKDNLFLRNIWKNLFCLKCPVLKLKINDGERVKVISRRDKGVFPALVLRTIRPDTIFIPYHWGENLAANQLTNPALDPTSKIPEYKACAARIEKIHSHELPILSKNRKGASLSEVRRGK